MQYSNETKMAMKPKTKMTMPMFQTNAGSGSCRTIMNPIQMSISPRLTSIMRQQMPLVFGQKGLGADMVSTTTPALVVEELGLTRLLTHRHGHQINYFYSVYFFTKKCSLLGTKQSYLTLEQCLPT